MQPTKQQKIVDLKAQLSHEVDRREQAEKIAEAQREALQRIELREREQSEKDAWRDLSSMVCATCFFFVEKRDGLGRCRRHAPTMNGYPVVFPVDWCGDHKLGRR